MRERESLGGCKLVSWHVVGRDGNSAHTKVLWVYVAPGGCGLGYVVHPMWLRCQVEEGLPIPTLALRKTCTSSKNRKGSSDHHQSHVTVHKSTNHAESI